MNYRFANGFVTGARIHGILNMAMTPPQIRSVRIQGFRSLADCELRNLGMATVLIGPNGAGKSNFIRFFEMMSWMLKSRKLGDFVAMHGGASDQLFGGSEKTTRIKATISLQTEKGLNDYRFELGHGHPDRLIFMNEAFRFSRTGSSTPADWQHLESGHPEAQIVEAAQSSEYLPDINRTTARAIVRLLRDCAVYQFHDTSDTSSFKKRWDASDNNYLRSHGGNLAAILHRLEQEDIKRFNLICRHITRILPVFERFEIEESYGKVLLRWAAKGTDQTLGPHLTSDGSLRFFALVTLLNLPQEMLPSVLLLDEPELGLHPAAISLIGDMIKGLATERQIIVATQSPLLVDLFGLEEIIVLEMEDGKTQFRALQQTEYQHWLDSNFTTGELWRKNVLGGRP